MFMVTLKSWLYLYRIWLLLLSVIEVEGLALSDAVWDARDDTTRAPVVRHVVDIELVSTFRTYWDNAGDFVNTWLDGFDMGSSNNKCLHV